MTYPSWLAPESARVAIPVLLAIGYAGYHWWRWRMMHPKIVLDELPVPASKVVTIEEGRVPDEPPAKAEAEGQKEEERQKEEEGPLPAEPPAIQAPPERLAEIEAKKEAERARAQTEREAFDPACIRLAFRRARGSRPEYYVRLGEYAWCRGALVETHFWLSLAKCRGVEGLDEWLDEVRRRWLREGRPDEVENQYPQFPFQRGELARAHIMLLSGFSAQVNYDIIVGMAQSADKDAQLLLTQLG